MQYQVFRDNKDMTFLVVGQGWTKHLESAQDLYYFEQGLKGLDKEEVGLTEDELSQLVEAFD